MDLITEALERHELDPSHARLVLRLDDFGTYHNAGDQSCGAAGGSTEDWWTLADGLPACAECSWDVLTVLSIHGTIRTDHFKTHQVNLDPDALGVEDLRKVVISHYRLAEVVPAAREVLERALGILASERVEELRQAYLAKELEMLAYQVSDFKAAGLTEVAKDLNAALTKARSAPVRWSLVADSGQVFDVVLALVLERMRYGKVFLVPDALAAFLVRTSEASRDCAVLGDRDERLAEAVGAVYDPSKGSSTSTLKKALKVAKAL
jgi:hypothetical protein